IVERLGEVGGAELIDTLLYIMFGDTSLAANTPEVQQWRAFMEKLDPGIGDAAFQVIHRKSIVGELAGVGVPVLAISGSEDHAYPPPISDENIAAATGGDHVRVEQAGHSTSLEQSQLVAEHVLRFIQALPAA
ncbi:MAG: alpha/beta hydrolase, partial [Allobranchiibius sp.]